MAQPPGAPDQGRSQLAVAPNAHTDSPVEFVFPEENTVKPRRDAWWARVRRATAALAAAACGAALWAAGAAAVGAPLLPGGAAFALVALYAAALASTRAADALRLPGLLGPLAAGVAARSLRLVALDAGAEEVAALLRQASIALIMSAAGLGLEPAALRRLSGAVLRLALLPGLVEVAAVAVASYLLLDLPWLWGAMLGASLAAISPAVVIPCLNSLRKRGFVVDGGIATIIVAAASLDDVVAFTAFQGIFSVIFSSGDLGWRLSQGPIGLLIGLGFGLTWGAFCGFVPYHTIGHKSGLRVALVAAGGLLAQFGGDALEFESAGVMGCVVSAMVAAALWRRFDPQGNEAVAAAQRLMDCAWAWVEPVLFALVGAEVDLRTLDARASGLGAAALAIALILRLVVSVLAAYGEDFTFKERIFIAFAWFPKATVQAALGPVALDAARALQPPSPLAVARGRVLLNVNVLSILLTAPAGAAFMALGGPRLLRRRADAQQLPGPPRTPDAEAPVPQSSGDHSPPGPPRSLPLERIPQNHVVPPLPQKITHFIW
ncbi:hypothetical protein R5R35_000980 [Gryllus longicercus]|uniref:Cation/H+ exchanger transmembrane domain-containing protein n=1 Tax=Gryllus longicercus TaxID=2509291 RepID=A0AAN9VS03_9ORTH